MLRNPLRLFSTFGSAKAPIITSVNYVKLANDTKHSAITVKSVMNKLEYLIKNDLSALDDFKHFCHDPKYNMWPSSIETLTKMKLLNCATAHNVVLTAVEGSKLTLQLKDPIATPTQTASARNLRI